MKEQFSCQETKSLWGRRLLQSVPITLSLFVAIGSTAELMAANVVESAVSQQVAQFSGSVVDVNGEPLIGVNVLEKGTTNGTITDFDGKFTLNLSSSNIKYIDNQLVTVIKIQMICKCKYKTI